MSRDPSSEVRVSTASGAVWKFVAPSPATTYSEVTAERIRRCEQLFEAFGPFMTPTRIESAIELHDTDEPLDPTERAGEEREVVAIELADETGLTAADFVDATQVDRPGVRYMLGVRFTRGRFTLRFEHRDQLVDTSNTVLYQNGERRDVSSPPSPISIHVSHYPADDSDPVETAFKTTICVYLHGDVWVGESESAHVNRRYLGEFLADIDDAVSSASVERERYDTADFWHDLGLYTKEDGNYPFDMEAIY